MQKKEDGIKKREKSMDRGFGKKTDSICFKTEDGKEVRFFVLEETMLAGENYLLVSEGMDDEETAYIMRELSEENEDKVYEMVEDEKKIEALAKVFSELIDDVELK